MVDAYVSARQARKAAGNLGVELRKTQGLTFWTLTVWQDQKAMASYRTTGPHKSAMPKLKQWCDEASVVHWSQHSDALPEWKDAEQQMLSSGRLSSITYPSQMHARGEINVS